MEYVMEILHITRKVETMNILERFHIYNENKLDYQINYMCTMKSNIIFLTIIQTNTSRGHSRAVIFYICLGLVQSQVATKHASLPIHHKKNCKQSYSFTPIHSSQLRYKLN